MESFRLVINPLSPSDYTEAAEIYNDSQHFIVEISGETATALELVTKEAAEAQTHNAIFAGIKLKKNRRMIGIASYIPAGYKGQPSQAWLALLLIAERFHRYGYGSEAYKLIEETIFINPEVCSIRLGVLANNLTGFQFWQKKGYQDTGIRGRSDFGHEIKVMEKSR